MLTLILGISLGLLFLFVIVLLITEVAANYPVWKQFDRNVFSFGESTSDKRSLLTQQRFLKPVLIGLGFFFFLSLVTVLILRTDEPAPALKEQATTQEPKPKVLSAHSPDYAMQFRLHTKWEDGKLYGNCTSTFPTDTVRPPTNCRLFLLDKDGFLVKAILFGPDDFVLEASAGSPSKKMVARFNTELTIDDYLKIEKLQVAVDGKVLGSL